MRWQGNMKTWGNLPRYLLDCVGKLGSEKKRNDEAKISSPRGFTKIFFKKSAFPSVNIYCFVVFKSDPSLLLWKHLSLFCSFNALETSIFRFSFFFLFFSKFKKLNISLIYWAIIIIFQWIFLFDPTTWITSRTTSRWRSSYTKFHKRQNDRKGRYTMVHFWKNCKKLKMRSQEQKNVVFG